MPLTRIATFLMLTIPQPIAEAASATGGHAASNPFFWEVPLQVSDIIDINPGVHLVICSEAQIWDKWMYSELYLKDLLEA